MKKMRIFGAVVFCTLFMAVAFSRQTAFAQEEPAKAESKQEPEAKPEHSQEQEKPEKNQAKPENPQKSEKDAEKNEKDNAKRDKSNSQPAAAESGSGREQAGQQVGQSRPSGKGGHIPDDKFHASFGRGHTFKVSRPVVVNNQTTIQYGGYSFIFVDAWPSGWAYTDDCYIDYIDGEYFLFDLLHPGVRIALIVMM